VSSFRLCRCPAWVDLGDGTRARGDDYAIVALVALDPTDESSALVAVVDAAGDLEAGRLAIVARERLLSRAEAEARLSVTREAE
jgi:hypothetical protein